MMWHTAWQSTKARSKPSTFPLPNPLSETLKWPKTRYANSSLLSAVSFGQSHAMRFGSLWKHVPEEWFHFCNASVVVGSASS